jgi:hypothetical protein
MEQNKPQHEEKEVELVPIFVWVSRGISNFFNGIGRLFSSLGHLFILLLVFIQRNFLLIAVVTLLGGALGWYLNNQSKSNYSGEMVVQPNFKSTSQLYSQINQLQSYVNEKKTPELVKVLGITSSQASTIKSLEVKPFFNETELLIEYDKLTRKTDSVALESATFNGFKSAKRDIDYESQSIIISGTNPYAINKALDKLLDLKETSSITASREAEIETVDYQITALLYQAEQIAGLLTAYKTAIETTNTNPTGSSNSFYLNGLQGANNYENLFNQKNAILYDLNEARAKKYSYNKTVNELSRYIKKGTIVEKYVIIKGLLVFFILGLLIASIPGLWRFLKDYEENYKR